MNDENKKDIERRQREEHFSSLLSSTILSEKGTMPRLQVISTLLPNFDRACLLIKIFPVDPPP